jgi:hypothetical protein
VRRGALHCVAQPLGEFIVVADAQASRGDAVRCDAMRGSALRCGAGHGEIHCGGRCVALRGGAMRGAAKRSAA